MTITVGAVNDPPAVSLANTATTLNENTNTASRIRVADIVVTDDGLGTNGLALSGSDAAMFEIVGTQLYLKAGAALDYETNPVLDVIVAVDDPAVGASPDATAALTIAVTNVNEPPTVSLANKATTLNENASTASRIRVADIVVTDDGLGTNGLACPAATRRCSKSSAPQLYLKAGAALDYETNPVLDVIVAVDDPAVGTSPDATAALTIAVTNVNEPPAVALANTTTTLNENANTASRIRVADIVVTDDGLGTNGLTLSGSDAAMFEIVGRSSYLKAGTALDYETNPVLDVIVAVDDPAVGTSPDATAALTIAVTNVNEPPAVSLANKATTLRENASTASRIRVADIVVTDDGQGTNGLALSGSDAAMFEIVGPQLYLKAGATLDYETNPVLDVIVAVDDPAVGTSPDATAALTIAVTNVNEPPAVSLANTTTTLREDASTASRIRVADIVVTDDGLGTNGLSLSGSDATMFEIVGPQLYLKAGATLDYETNPVLDVDRGRGRSGGGHLAGRHRGVDDRGHGRRRTVGRQRPVGGVF